jgi:DNA processing protein
VVGSRAATPAGLENAGAFARAIAASGFAVASGLAAGIDTAAHAAALAVEGGRTVAVLGTGPDVAYPRSNTALHTRIVRTGAVVSEHLPGTLPRPEHFPSRNRILAGLALGTVVIEAAQRSGALITARLAAEAGREVFAVPGSIHNPMARGCHRLIRDGATLVEDATELIAALAPQAQQLAADLRERLGAPIPGGPNPGSDRPAAGATGLAGGPAANDRDYQTLWGALGHDPTGMDQLVARTGLTPAVVSSMLLLMELDGRVSTQHGRYYRTG